MQPLIHVSKASTCNQLYTQLKHRQPVIYKQRKHRQPVIQATQAQATTYTRSTCTSNASTGNQLYRQRKHRQPVIQAAQAQATQAQATSYTSSANPGNQLYMQRKHKLTVMHVLASASVLRCLYNWLPVL